MKRFVIILLALLSGLSVPQAVAAATGGADASVMSAPLNARSAQPSAEAQARSAQPVRRLDQTDPVAIPGADFAPAPRTVQFGDRARE